MATAKGFPMPRWPPEIWVIFLAETKKGRKEGIKNWLLPAFGRAAHRLCTCFQGRVLQKVRKRRLRAQDLKSQWLHFLNSNFLFR